ncbi:MAG: imidazole glycerol phosphate synthase subunit HisH [Candidatus Omnitrophica bacterium]|nr:imidazole glycerol phosphate synthase subunit HisH [Candidatus Omnitrophota bacterium]
MIVIVDYGMGNLLNVAKAFEYIGESVKITQDRKVVARADRLIVPGVGAFGDAVKELQQHDLFESIVDFVGTGRPCLGICLGLQLFLNESSESPGIPGLGIIDGKNILFAGKPFEGKDRLKVPHMGWNKVRIIQKTCPLFKTGVEDAFFYFVHSYYASVTNRAYIVGETEYGITFASMLWKDNVFATQFHPEKSQRVGLELLKGFAQL